MTFENALFKVCTVVRHWRLPAWALPSLFNFLFISAVMDIHLGSPLANYYCYLPRYLRYNTLQYSTYVARMAAMGAMAAHSASNHMRSLHPLPTLRQTIIISAH
jgi:hypothetical protein